MGGVEDGAGADFRAFHFSGDRAHRIEGGRGAHGDLDGPQTACNERSREQDGRFRVLNDQDWNDGLEFQDGKEFFCLLAHGHGSLKRLKSAFE
ncbi:hypothetical protein GCM10010520_39930 [Rhizobium viscosum]